MKIPKKVTICGKTYTVIKDKEQENGFGGVFKQLIVVGTKGQADERIFDTFLHEVAELVACENNYRYGNGHSETSMFAMSHKEFERFIGDISTAIFSMIKEK